MKKLLLAWHLAVFALFLPSRCHAAQDGISPLFTYQAAVSSITTVVVNVSTSGASTGATQVDNPQLFSRVALEIQNIDTAANLWCLPVSTTPVTNAGRKIAPGNSWIVSAVDTFYQLVYSTTTQQNTNVKTPVKFWCASDGASATKAVVTQLY